MSWLRGWLRVALIDLRGDLVRRFVILLACLALGVGTIAFVGSVGASLQSALVRDARSLLGGDMQLTLSYRSATDEERKLFNSLGRVAEVVEVLNRGHNAKETAFLSIRAVDANYPLLGTATVQGTDQPLHDLLAMRDGLYGLVADSILLDRLNLKIGDTLTIGSADFAIRGIIGKLPDQLLAGVGIGIPALISLDGLAATQILEPGVLATRNYKILLDPPDFFAAEQKINDTFPNAGWKISTPRDATADLSRFFDIFGRFLTIVGLSALLVGGVGVSNAVSAYVTERQRAIATMKALGATGARVLFHFLTQVLLLTLVGIVFGLFLGGALTLIALPLLGSLIGIPLPAVIDAGALWTAAGFGLLTGFTFAYLPLQRALHLRPALLFRSAGSAVEGGLTWQDLLKPGLWLPLGIAAVLIYGLAAVSTLRPLLVLYYALGVIVAFLVLRLAGFLLQTVIRLIPPLPNAFLRNALKSIYRPGTPAPVVILSLGLGLALLLLIALLDGNLRHQLDRESIPNAPSFVFMDLFDDEVADVENFAKSDPGVENFEALPLVTGSIEAIDGVPVKQRGHNPPPEFAFVLEGEIPITAAATLPERSTVESGAWWPADYQGPPQVSVFERLREPLGLKLGDEITFRIFGQPVKATIASFRDYAWRSGGVNFGFVLSPDALSAFPLTYLGLLKAAPGAERELQQRLVENFADLNFFPIGDALETFAVILASVSGAVEAIGGLAVASGVLVLAGAMAAGRRQREADAVVMKVLGATRRDVISSYLVEYGLLGLLAAVLASILGLVGTWAFVEYVLELDFWPDTGVIAWVLAGAMLLTIAVGTITTWSALSVKPASFLREE